MIMEDMKAKVSELLKGIDRLFVTDYDCDVK